MHCISDCSCRLKIISLESLLGASREENIFFQLRKMVTFSKRKVRFLKNRFTSPDHQMDTDDHNMFIPKFCTTPHCTLFPVLSQFVCCPASILSIRLMYFVATTVTHTNRHTTFLVLFMSLSQKSKREMVNIGRHQHLAPPKAHTTRRGTNTLNYCN